jgi:A-kinase anchor protein 1
VCIVEGTRTAIDRCLLLIREKLPLDQYPELTLDQINRPSENDVLLKQQPAVSGSEASAVQLIPGQLSDVLVSAIVSGGHVFVQQPNHPTYPAMERLEHCMFNVYERLKNRIPHVPREIIDAGLACVAKVDDRYYRLEVRFRDFVTFSNTYLSFILFQVVSYDVPTDCCEVKFLDYGGYDTVYASDLWQIRSDFLTLPFQVYSTLLTIVE